jgi:murein DD-endopeptidase MepM/ murein hydrolase activator NlpD
MKDASQYPITTGYGQIPNYPLNNGFHRGVDRACPTGTPLLVNGVLIGKTGTTGASTGPHLHLGRFVNGQPTDPGNGGFILVDATVTETGQDATSGKFIKVRDSGGAVWFYCHLSEILTKAGDKLVMDKITKEQENSLSIMQTGSMPGVNYDYRFTGKPLTQANLDAMLQFWAKQPRPSSTKLKPGLYEV